MIPVAASPNKMTQLAQATRAAHLRLHADGPFSRIAEGRFGVGEVAVVVGLHLRAWRLALSWADKANALHRLFDCPTAEFFRSEALEHAAKDLGCADMPRPVVDKSPQALLAGAYVFLGSQKGGVTLSRNLANSGYHDAALCFSPSADHRKQWDTLTAHVNGLPGAEFSAMCTSANQWFDSFDFDHAQA